MLFFPPFCFFFSAFKLVVLFNVQLLPFFPCDLTSHSVSCLSPSVGGVPVERVAVYSGPGWAS